MGDSAMSFWVEFLEGRPSRIHGETVNELYACLAAGRPPAYPLPGFMVGAMLDAAQQPPAIQSPPAIPAPAPTNGKPATSAELLDTRPPSDKPYRRNKREPKPDTRPNHHAKPSDYRPHARKRGPAKAPATLTKSEILRRWLAKHKPTGDAARPSAIAKAVHAAHGITLASGHVSAVLAQLKGGK
jgi:hypothetical protein